MKTNRTTALMFILLILSLGIYFFLNKKDPSEKSSQAENTTNTTATSQPSPSGSSVRQVSSVPPTSSGLTGSPVLAAKSRTTLTSQDVLEWVRKNEDIARFDLQEDTKLSESLKTEFTEIFYFQQMYKGYKVFNRHLRVIVNKETQEILRVKNNFYDIPPLSSESYQPLEIAKEHLTHYMKIAPLLLTSNMTEPEVFVQDGKSYLIWRIAQKSHPQKEPEETLFVDAATGQVLKRESTRMY